VSLDIHAVARVAALECERQQVDLHALSRLLAAYAFVYENQDVELSIGHVIMLGSMVEPVKARKFRITPVTFRNGGSSAPHDMIYELLEHRIEERDLTVEEFIKEFLWIHPFEDGNGRVAWILQNWLNKTMDRPDTLKEYRW